MRFLLDQNLSPLLVGEFTVAGHDAVHVRDLGMSRASDRVILERLPCWLRGAPRRDVSEPHLRQALDDDGVRGDRLHVGGAGALPAVGGLHGG